MKDAGQKKVATCKFNYFLLESQPELYFKSHVICQWMYFEVRTFRNISTWTKKLQKKPKK